MATPPDFTTGQVLTAAQMDAVGLWLVKTQTVGSAVSTVTVSDAFTSDYRNYRIIYSGGTCSGAADLRLRLGAANTGYYFGGNYATYAGVAGVWNGANVAYFTAAGGGGPSGSALICDLLGPQVSGITGFYTLRMAPVTNNVGGANAGYIDANTQFTSFEISPSSGTMTGGVIRVYGYRD